MSNKLSFQYVVNDIIKNHFFNLIKINLFFALIIFIVYTFLPKTYYADTSLTQSGNSADSILGNTRSLANTVGINLPNNSFSDFFLHTQYHLFKILYRINFIKKKRY